MLDWDRTILDVWADYEGSEPSFEGLPLLPTRQQADLLSVIHDAPFRTFLSQSGANIPHTESVEAWVKSFKSSSDGVLYSPHEAAQSIKPRLLIFLDSIRRVCVQNIEEQLQAAHLRQEIPAEGVFLTFPDNLSVCYLSNYEVHADRVSVNFVDCILRPKALLGIEDLWSLQSGRSRNLAKAFIQSGHKTIIHGGVLTHVDRRIHPRVFGPTIDTLLLASIASNYVRTAGPKSVMEVGVGSGHIYSSIASHSPGPVRLCGLDIESSAVLCTDTNSYRNIQIFGRIDAVGKLVVGSFDPSFFADRFDLLVSNPPYISRNASGKAVGRQTHARATSGTELILDMLRALPTLLTEGGRALLMLSTTSFGVDQHVPSGFRMVNCLAGEKVDVPFDVEGPLDDSEWLNELLEEGGIIRESTGYVHGLRPVWIERNPC